MPSDDFCGIKFCFPIAKLPGPDSGFGGIEIGHESGLTPEVIQRKLGEFALGPKKGTEAILV